MHAKNMVLETQQINLTLNFPVLGGIFRKGGLIVLVVALNKVLKDGAAFKDTELLPVGPCIRNGRDPAIRVDL